MIVNEIYVLEDVNKYACVLRLVICGSEGNE